MAKEYELVGGQPVKITPLEVDEAGTYEAPAGQAFNPVKVSGGGGLPEVTDADNGDVLTVVEGAWAKAAPSGGGGGIFWVTLTYDNVENTFNANKSYNDVVGAVGSGLLPVFIGAEDNNFLAIRHLWSCTSYDGGYSVIITGDLEAEATTATENLVFSTK